VVGASPRVALTGDFKSVIPIPSEEVSAAGNISQPGIVNLAENYDSHWQAILNGKEIPLRKNANGLPSYTVTPEMLTNKGVNQITILHTSQVRRIALSFQVLAFLVVFILALPAGRKKGSIS
jgi:hypothetical protein